MKHPKAPWWQVLIKVIFVGGAVTVLSFGASWVGITLWGFFKKPPSAPKRPNSAESAPLERPSKPDPLPEGASTSLVGDSLGINRLEGTNPTVRTLQFKKRSIQETIKAKKVLIREKEQLISISHGDTKAIEKFGDLLRASGFSEEEIKLDPNYPQLAVEESIRNNYRAQIVALRDEIQNLEASIPQIPEPIPLDEAAASPARRRARPAPQQISASSSSARTTEIRRTGSSPARTRSPGPSDSEIPRIGSGEDE